MEVTTVSPSPVSPTEGDDLCETDVTIVAIHSVTLLICLCGLAGNGAMLWLLSLKRYSYILFDLAVADFLFLLLTVPSALLFLVEDMSCSPIVPLTYVKFVFQLSVASYYWGLFKMIHSKNDLPIYLFCCCIGNIPLRLQWLMHSVQFWAFFAVFTIIPTVAFLCPSHQQEHCQAALISLYTIILIHFAIHLLCYSIVFYCDAMCSQKEQTKNYNIVSIVIMLFTLLFLLCNFLQQLGYIPLSAEVFLLLTCINSSIKPFIYFLVGKRRRLCSMGSLQPSLRRVLEEPEENTAHSHDPAMDTGV